MSKYIYTKYCSITIIYAYFYSLPVLKFLKNTFIVNNCTQNSGRTNSQAKAELYVLLLTNFYMNNDVNAYLHFKLRVSKL